MPISNRAHHLPPYIFAQIHEDIARMEQDGKTIIDLGISDPDVPPRPDILDTLCTWVRHSDSHRYPSYRGLAPLRQAVAEWYLRRFGVYLDPESEVLITVGSKEALVHFALATVNPGQAILVPDPGYPSYQIPSALFGFESILMPLIAANHFLPDFERISSTEWSRIQLGFFNYPNNPTGAMAPEEFWHQAIELAHRHQWTIVSDLAYVDIVYTGQAHSILEYAGAREVAVETVTFSKSYSMQGFRLAAMVGCAEILEAFYRVESQINAGVYLPIQHAGIAALRENVTPDTLATYQKRRDFVVSSLQHRGFTVETPPATLYVWLPVPKPDTDQTFVSRLLHQYGIAVAPGVAFGPLSDRFIRIALTKPLSVLKEAFARWPAMTSTAMTPENPPSRHP